MREQALSKTINSGLRKSNLLHSDWGRYLLRSVLAGLYLSIIVFLYWTLSYNLAGNPFGKVVASLFFGVGLFVIIITQSELFTSNAMYLTVSSLAHRTSWAQTLRSWAVCYIGNLLGAIIVALLLLGAGVYAGMPADHALYVGALHKIEQPAHIIFFKGILANWVVCLAVWVALHLKEDIAKLLSTILIVSVFLYLGFEHSIANLGTFAMALLGGNTITFGGAAYNLLWSTLGNLVGGGLVVGFSYWYLDNTEPRPATIVA